MLQSLPQKFLLITFVTLITATGSLQAGKVESLYDVDVLVVDESASVRWGAFKKGLDEVFVRISGDSIIMDKLKRPPPTTYVKQFSYEPVENPPANDKGVPLSHRLKIHYNGTAMQKYLSDNGFPVWGEHRQDVVIWLAVRDGRNEYVLRKSDQSLIKKAADEAMISRGVPVDWPLYDRQDRKLLGIADIRGGFKDPVTSASKRYSRGPALTGSIIWNGSQWQSNWSLLMQDQNSHWSMVDGDYNKLIHKAVDQAADRLGNVFAVHGTKDKRQLAEVQMDIENINTIGKYRRIEDYLKSINVVAEVFPKFIDGNRASFIVSLNSDEKDFLNLIKNEKELTAVEIKPEAIPTLDEHSGQTSGLKTSQTVPDTVSPTVAGESALKNNQPPIPVYHYRL